MPLCDVAVTDLHYYSYPGVHRSDSRHAVKDTPQERYHGQRYVPTNASIGTGMYNLTRKYSDHNSALYHHCN